jgi:hypothetical protein
MKKMGISGLVLVLLACVGLFSSGCGEDSSEQAAERMIEEAIEQAAEREGEVVDVEIDEGGLTVRSKDGTASFKADGDTMVVKTDEGSMRIGTGATLPAGFPKDVPIYDGATVVQSMEMGEMVMVTLETADPFATVVASYKEECPDNGWTEEASMKNSSGDPTQMLNYRQGERSLMVSVIQESNRTMVSLTVSRE